MAHHRRKPHHPRENAVSVHPMVARAAGALPTDRPTGTAPSRKGRKHHDAPVLANDPAGVLLLILGAMMMIVLTPVIALWVPTDGAGTFWASLLALIVFTNGANLAGVGARMADRSLA